MSRGRPGIPSLEEEAARTALSPAQTQALLERLKKEKIFSKA